MDGNGDLLQIVVCPYRNRGSLRRIFCSIVDVLLQLTPLQSAALNTAAASLEATPIQVALAWLLQRSPDIVLIPGTSSVKHLRENLDAAALKLSPETITRLDLIVDSAKKTHAKG